MIHGKLPSPQKDPKPPMPVDLIAKTIQSIEQPKPTLGKLKPKT